MNCLTCGVKLARKQDLHPHLANHDAVRLANSKEYVEAVKDIPQAKDERITDA